MTASSSVVYEESTALRKKNLKGTIESLQEREKGRVF